MFENWGPQHWKHVILIVTIFTTYYIYHRKILSTVRTSAIVVLLQIQNIEKNIDIIAKECLDKDGNAPDRNVFYSDNVYEIDYWEQNKHVLVDYLSKNDFKTISGYYDNASKIKSYHEEIKNVIIYGYQSKVMNYYSGIYNNVTSVSLDDKNSIMDYLISIINSKILKYNKENKNSKELENILEGIAQLQLHKFNNIFVAPYIINEYVFALNKYVKVYRPISGTTAFAALEKLSKRKYW